MNSIKTEKLTNEQKIEIFHIWNNEYPKKLAFQKVENFDEYLSKLEKPMHHILLNNKDKIIGWGIDFYRDNQKWFALLIDNKEQKNGFGKKLLNELKKHNTELNGWVIDHDNDIKITGEKYNSPLGFYLKNNFEILSEHRLENEILSAVKINWCKNKV